MSRLFYLFNQSILKSKNFNVSSSNKLFINNRGIFYAFNKNYTNGKKLLIVSTQRTLSRYATTHDLRLDETNVLSSSCDDLDISREFLHEFVWKNLEKWPNKTAIVCSTTGKSYTYYELRVLSGKFASSLRKCKLYHGSTITLVLPNIPEYAIIFLGASEAGVKVSMCNPISTAKEIRRQLENSDSSAVVTILENYPVVKESIVGNSNIKLPIILVDDTGDSLPDGIIRFSELISDSVDVFNECQIPNRNNEETICLPYSSGTTGLPKGVDLSHRNLVMNCKQLQAKKIYPGYETTETHQDVLPLVLPAFHIYGLVVIIVNYLSVGAKIVSLRKFNPESFMNCLKNFKPTILYVAPPVILFSGNSELITKHHLESLRFVMTGAAPIGSESVERFRTKAQRHIVLAQGYGLTETSPVISTSNDGVGNLDSVGILVPNTKIRVVGTDDSNKGRNLGVNEIGELYVKGPQVMKGYYKNPEATANTMDGEWMKTGDVGCFDEAGRIFIKDRLKELIKVKGFQVPPAELEELIRSNEDVLDVGVIGEAHPKYGEIPKAYVVCKPGVKPDENKIKQFVAERVPSYKQLGSVKFIEEIPKNPSGKILRKQLKNL